MTFLPVKNAIFLLKRIRLLLLFREIIASYTNLERQVNRLNPASKIGRFLVVKSGRM